MPNDTFRLPQGACPASLVSGGTSEPWSLRRFVTEYGEALHNAATLLGGKPHARSVNEIRDRLEYETVPSDRTLRLVASLLDLLSLELVNDLESPEAALFAAISPEDPAVEEICLLTDALRHVFAGELELAAQRRNPEKTPQTPSWRAA
jgi:hypothetical protein